jgi:hypothetical protein
MLAVHTPLTHDKEASAKLRKTDLRAFLETISDVNFKNYWIMLRLQSVRWNLGGIATFPAVEYT